MKKITKKVKVSFILTFTIVLSVLGQEKTSYKVFNNYRNYGFTIAATYFKKASITRNSGNTVLNTHPDFNMVYGFKKYFKKELPWSYFIGLSLNDIPSTNYDYVLKAYDIPFDEDDYEETISDNKESHRYLTGLIGLEHKMQLSNKLFFNANLSLNISYLQRGGIYSSLHIIDEEANINRENFAIKVYTPDNEIQASAKVSAGLYFPLKYFLLQTNLVYNKNFQNVLEGEYQFGNLFVSEPTIGDYKVSGDYFGLQTTFFFKRSKKSFIKRVQ